jgi:hypothetical protein
MAKYTPNINLYKPDRKDTDVEVDTSLAGNFDKIDKEINDRKTEIVTLNTFKESAETRITDLEGTTATTSTELSSFKQTTESSIGVLAELATTNKASLVTAINEVDSFADSADSRLTTLEGTTATTSSDVSTLKSNVGVLTNLQTTDQTNLVGAINEVKSLVGTGGVDTSSFATKTELNTLDEEVNAHLAESVSEQMIASRDMTILGQQTISGFSKLPKRLDILAYIPTTKKFSVGNVSSNNQSCIYRVEADSVLGAAGKAVVMGADSSNLVTGNVTINPNKTITIDWGKDSNGVTGSCTLMITAHFHD